MISSREMVWVVNDNSTVVGFDEEIVGVKGSFIPVANE